MIVDLGLKFRIYIFLSSHSFITSILVPFSGHGDHREDTEHHGTHGFSKWTSDLHFPLTLLPHPSALVLRTSYLELPHLLQR
jgi:hypothetical protein